MERTPNVEIRCASVKNLKKQVVPCYNVFDLIIQHIVRKN